jgi:Tfp pilus assembly protein PilN
MIRINLLQEKKAKKVDKGQQSLLIGVVAILGAAAGVFFLLHQPLSSEVDELKGEVDKKQANIKKLQSDTKEFDAVQAQVSAAEAQEAAIDRLNNARAVPSWMLFELSSILTKDHKPTMSQDMAERVKNDPNRVIPPWDPKRLWILAIEEVNGVLTITGGAQSTSDITAFAQRLQASVFFSDITPVATSTVMDNQSRLSYYNFTITGKVLY